jgi:copper type II ascorbate-dependent monooxygenase-like protein
MELFDVEVKLMRDLALVCMIAVAGCSGGSAPTNMDPAPPTHGLQVKTPDYTLAAGEEKYLCYGMQLAEANDIAITSFASFTSDQVHHMEVFQALAPEAPGLNECDGTFKLTWLPLFGGGKNAGGLQLPSGAGFKLPKDASLIVQIHLLNATQAPVTQHLVVNMDYAADPTAVTPAGIFAFGSMTIDLPAHSMGMQITSSCKLPLNMNVFAAQPHMHYLGTKLEFDLGASADSMSSVYGRDPWQFGGQPIDNWVQNLQAGQFGKVTCTYDNTTDHDVQYGESTNNEMCYLVLFYTPFDRLNGCVN